MGRSSDLDSLIQSLADADSAFERMHALGLAWRSLRKLPASERKLLARHAGFDGAEELIEKLAAHRGGIAPSILLQAIQEARNARPQRLKSIFAALRKPETRVPTLLKALDSLSGKLAGPDVKEETKPGETSGAEEMNSADAAESPIADIPEDLRNFFIRRPPAEEPGEEETGDEKVEKDLPVGNSPPAQEEEAAPSPVKQDIEPESPGSPETPPAPVTPDDHPAPLISDDPPPAASPSEGAEDTGVQHPRSRDSRLADELLHAKDLIQQFKVFGTHGSTFLSIEGVRDILGIFPDGWARRRAFLRMLESGWIADSATASKLLDLLSGEHNRRWCRREIERRWPTEGLTQK